MTSAGSPYDRRRIREMLETLRHTTDRVGGFPGFHPPRRRAAGASPLPTGLPSSASSSRISTLGNSHVRAGVEPEIALTSAQVRELKRLETLANLCAMGHTGRHSRRGGFVEYAYSAIAPNSEVV